MVTVKELNAGENEDLYVATLKQITQELNDEFFPKLAHDWIYFAVVSMQGRVTKNAIS